MASSLKPAVILIAHGSPDPDWRRPIEATRERLAARLPDRPVVAAYMEFADPSLSAAVAELHAAGHRQIEVLAAFLSPGGRHIKRDLPALIEEIAAGYSELNLHLHPGALGADPEVSEALAEAACRALED